MQLLNFLIFISCVVTASCTRHIPSVETSFYTNVIMKYPNTSNSVCPVEYIIYELCKELFLRPHYRYELKVYTNTSAFWAFRTGEVDLCEKLLITFTTIPENFPKNRFENMFACLGRRSIIRTNHEVDEYLKKFYLYFTPTQEIFYVFRAEKHGEQVQIKFYEEIRENMFEKVVFHDKGYNVDEVLRELELPKIEMYNHWQHEIENIFVNEMILDKNPKENQLENLDSTSFVYLCLYMLQNRNPPDAEDSFRIDIPEMLKRKPQLQKIKLYFDYEIQFNESQHEAYQCYGMHPNNNPRDNLILSNRFLLSSGPQKDTIFVFSYLSNENNYMLKSLVANVDFNNFYETVHIFEKYHPGPSGPVNPVASFNYPGPSAPSGLYMLPRPSAPSWSPLPSASPEYSEQYYVPQLPPLYRYSVRSGSYRHPRPPLPPRSSAPSDPLARFRSSGK